MTGRARDVALVALGVAVGAVVVASLSRPPRLEGCCATLATAARDKIGEAAGPFGPAAVWLMDALGITQRLPRIIERVT